MPEKDQPKHLVVSTQPDFLERQAAWDAYIEARDNVNADIGRLQDIVMKHGTGVNICLFAKDVKGASIPSLQEAIIQRGSVLDACIFARLIPGADTGALALLVADRGSDWDVQWFSHNAEYWDDANAQVLRDMLHKKYAHDKADVTTEKQRPNASTAEQMGLF